MDPNATNPTVPVAGFPGTVPVVPSTPVIEPTTPEPIVGETPTPDPIAIPEAPAVPGTEEPKVEEPGMTGGTPSPVGTPPTGTPAF